ncbi:MAG TPA: low-complexity tail membrane protein [Prochlorococcaceae cyanobacterium AMR_MDS_5431]|nr:low-complexity tail membrane protein [Prochlorococcaceae cyanobacterium AMR_MDS_5431]
MKELVQSQKQQKFRDVSTSRIHPYIESLLWFQLLGGTFLPIEALLILLTWSSTHENPLPTLYRLLTWFLGVLLPTIVLWYRPLDCWSLLVVQVPIRNRSLQQQALSLLRYPLWLKLLQASISLPLLMLIEKLDELSAQIITLSIFQDIPGSFGVSLSIILLILITYQWQQFIYAAWLMLTGNKHYYIDQLNEDQVRETESLERTLSLGLPIFSPKAINILNPKYKENDRL